MNISTNTFGVTMGGEWSLASAFLFRPLSRLVASSRR